MSRWQGIEVAAAEDEPAPRAKPGENRRNQRLRPALAGEKPLLTVGSPSMLMRGKEQNNRRDFALIRAITGGGNAKTGKRARFVAETGRG